MPGCTITCFRPPTPTLHPQDAQERMCIMAVRVTEMLLSRLPLHNGDSMLHLVFAYTLQALLADLRQSYRFTWPWRDLGALSPPVTGHCPASAKLLQPCLQPGLWSKTGFRVVLTSERAICPVPTIYVWLQILQNLNFKWTQEISFNWTVSVVPAMKPKILYWIRMYTCEFQQFYFINIILL